MGDVGDVRNAIQPKVAGMYKNNFKREKPRIN